MKKDQQVVMNDYVLKNYSRMMNGFRENWYNSVRLRSCQACVYETENFFVLKSYDTIVAFIDKNTQQKFDILRYVYDYTSTSAKHIAKFFSDYGDFRISTYTYREV